MSNCKYCGKKLDSNHVSFCNSICRAAYENKKREENIVIPKYCCKYNIGIDCISDIECDYCGWNPKVAEERLKQYAEVTV